MPRGAGSVTSQLLAGARTTHDNAFKLTLVSHKARSRLWARLRCRTSVGVAFDTVACQRHY
jgi:hypothetical protein